jgi:hypothetical protein
MARQPVWTMPSALRSCESCYEPGIARRVGVGDDRDVVLAHMCYEGAQ